MNEARNTSAIAEISAALTTEFDLPGLLAIVADQARIGLDASSVVVLLLDRRHSLGDSAFHVVAEATGDGSVSNFDFGIPGPALVSARDGVVAMIDDLADANDTRWPEYGRRALASGLRAVRAFPIASLRTPLGSMVVHTKDPWGTSRSQVFGQIMANLSAVALGNASIGNRHVDTTNTIESLLDGTKIISVATGMIAEVLGLDVRDAQLALSRLARAHGKTVTEYAQVIVDAQAADPTASEPDWVRPPDPFPPHAIG
jgi:hypothetical protein